MFSHWTTSSSDLKSPGLPTFEGSNVRLLRGPIFLPSIGTLIDMMVS